MRVLVGAAGSSTEFGGLPTATAGSSARAAAVPESAGGGRAWADRIGRGAVALTVLGAMVHLASLIARGVSTGRVPLGNMYEFTAVVGLIGVSAWLVTLVRVPTLRYVGMFVMLPVIIVMFIGGTVLYARAAPLVPALQSYWLRVHVTAICAGEGLLMVSAVFTCLFLIRNRYDAAVASARPVRGLTRMGASLPDAAALDKAAYRIVAFAFPIFTFGVICGAIWAEAAWGRYWGWDPKETWAFITWVVYAAYLHARATAGWKGRNAAWINVAGFGAMTFNFFVVNIVVSGLHSYAGLN